MLLNLKTIAVLVFCIIECNARNGRLSVKRGDQDIFENPNCLVANVTGCNCDGLNADCVSSTCTKCRCFGSDMTFISSTDKYGHCVKNNYLQFFPGKFVCIFTFVENSNINFGVRYRYTLIVKTKVSFGVDLAYYFVRTIGASLNCRPAKF